LQKPAVLKSTPPLRAVEFKPKVGLAEPRSPQEACFATTNSKDVTGRIFMSAHHKAGLALIVWIAAAIGLNSNAIAQQTVTIGVTTTGIPFTFVDTKTQKPTGAMVDLADAIAGDNGLTAKFELTAFSALVPSLTTRKIDMISAGMLVTAARKEIVDFSDPVYSYGEAMFVADSDKKNYTREDLKDETIGAQVGTSFADALKKTGLFKEIKLYDSIADITREVKLGRIKAGFGDAPIIAYQISQNADLGVRIVEGYKPLVLGDLALAVRKDDPDLLGKVNASIAKFKQNGKLAAILTKYSLAK
jgi:polar amino acid transport system substrate-binding protein